MNWDSKTQELKLRGVLEQETPLIDPWNRKVSWSFDGKRCVGIFADPDTKSDSLFFIFASYFNHKIEILKCDASGQWIQVYEGILFEGVSLSPLETDFHFYPGSDFGCEFPVMEIIHPKLGLRLFQIVIPPNSLASVISIGGLNAGSDFASHWCFQPKGFSLRGDVFLGSVLTQRQLRCHLYVNAQKEMKCFFWQKMDSDWYQTQLIPFEEPFDAQRSHVYVLQSPHGDEELLLCCEPKIGFSLLTLKKNQGGGNFTFQKIELTEINKHSFVQSFLAQSGYNDGVLQGFFLGQEKEFLHPSKKNPHSERSAKLPFQFLICAQEQFSESSKATIALEVYLNHQGDVCVQTSCAQALQQLSSLGELSRGVIKNCDDLLKNKGKKTDTVLLFFDRAFPLVSFNFRTRFSFSDTRI